MTKFEPVAIVIRGNYWSVWPLMDWEKFGDRCDLFTAAQMRQAEREAYGIAIQLMIERGEFEAIGELRALIEQESK